MGLKVYKVGFNLDLKVKVVISKSFFLEVLHYVWMPHVTQDIARESTLCTSLRHTGIVAWIEANPDYHVALLDKNRRAYVLQACLSTERRPATARMQPANVLGGIVDKMHTSHLAFIGANKKPQVSVVCFPLNAIMAALDIAHVHYLSLDVEGPELEIIHT